MFNVNYKGSDKYLCLNPFEQRSKSVKEFDRILSLCKMKDSYFIRTEEELSRTIDTAKKIQAISRDIIVVGEDSDINYLCSKAIIQTLSSKVHFFWVDTRQSSCISRLLQYNYPEAEDFSIILYGVDRNGPVHDLCNKMAENKYNFNSASHIYQIPNGKMDYLSLSLAGVNIYRFLEGVNCASEKRKNIDNDAYKIAAYTSELYRLGYNPTCCTGFRDELSYIACFCTNFFCEATKEKAKKDFIINFNQVEEMGKSHKNLFYKILFKLLIAIVNQWLPVITIDMGKDEFSIGEAFYNFYLSSLMLLFLLQA